MGSYLKAMGKAAIFLVILHFVLIVGAVGYLAGTDRLSVDRVKRIGEMFSLTLNEEVAKNEELAEALKLEQNKTAKMAKLSQIENGLQSRKEVIKQKQNHDDAAADQLAMAKMVNQAIEKSVAQATVKINRESKKIAEKIKNFEAEVQRQVDLRENKDFLKALKMYSASKPDVAKEMFQGLIAGGQLTEVVDYLSEMSARKRDKIMAEFKTPGELKTAVMLIEKVRTMKVDRLKLAAGKE